ncbi:Histidine kinase 2 [Zostera marina]|uniref:histidine kinase n=1 Tax=Zostera marina TaxID=29655 RepID=A0A0K9PQ75_ZOSMR|nr:Histidine kinase 2 [Zostera marina]
MNLDVCETCLRFSFLPKLFQIVLHWFLLNMSWNKNWVLGTSCVNNPSKSADAVAVPVADRDDGWRGTVLLLWVFFSGVLGSRWFSAETPPQSTSESNILRLKLIGWLLIGIIVAFFNSSYFSSSLRKKPWVYFDNKRQQHHPIQNGRKNDRIWGRKLLLLGVVTGVLISIWIFWSMSLNLVLRRKETLANMCDERARMLQDQFNVSMNHVHALAILISTFHHGKKPSAIDQGTFAAYTARTAFERPLISGVAYALRVKHSERAEFEKRYGWVIKKMESGDHSSVRNEYMPENLDPAPTNREYAPVILSQESVSHILSIDMMSGKEDCENILRARASGKGVLTSPFKLLKSNHLGVVLTFALYSSILPPNADPDERIRATIGYLGASFDVETLVEKLLQQLASKQTIVVKVFDTTEPLTPITMYGSDNEDDTGLLHTSSLEFGDPFRRHEMRCRFKQKPPLPWSAITMSVGVAVIIFLLGHIFYAGISRIEKVEDEYCKMQELKTRAEDADVAKSQFLATVSHEIRTPMNGVLGMLQMLIDTDLDATQQDFAVTAQASGKALIALINEVLDQAKIESGRLELESVSFDVRSILDNVIYLFSEKSHHKGIELAMCVSDRVPQFIIGDPGRFRQIITNIVSNSVKFTEKGHIFVSIRRVEEAKRLTRHNSGDNSLSGLPVVEEHKSWEEFKMLTSSSEPISDKINLLVTVEDTGVGIPKNAQGRIFMPFMQADSSTSRTYGGTGIGLSISTCLVGLMGGEIGFISRAGVGSTFAFVASFRQCDEIHRDPKRHPADAIVSDFQGMRGLVVDGRSVRAQVTKYHLQRLGVHVEIMIRPPSLFNCISDRERRLDIVLVDKETWTETEDDGDESFSRLIRNIEIMQSTANPPKIFLLATSLNPQQLEAIKSSGKIDSVIMKPIRLSKIIACLRKSFGIIGSSQKGRRQQQSVVLRNLLKEKEILVVDDNVVNRRVAAAALKKYGAVVTCVESGKIAVEILRPPHRFHACFMDVQMPEMDGFEATRRIRNIEDKVNQEWNGNVDGDGHIECHVPILAMTADVFQATQDECLRCGMDGYVSKPFEEEQLYSCVAHFLDSDTVNSDTKTDPCLEGD